VAASRATSAAGSRKAAHKALVARRLPSFPSSRAAAARAVQSVACNWSICVVSAVVVNEAAREATVGLAGLDGFLRDFTFNNLRIIGHLLVPAGSCFLLSGLPKVPESKVL
jgi:hypothetical protein